MGKKGPMKITYSIGGVPLDLESMPIEERRKMARFYNDRAMRAIGYVPVKQTEMQKTGE